MKDIYPSSFRTEMSDGSLCFKCCGCFKISQLGMYHGIWQSVNIDYLQECMDANRREKVQQEVLVCFVFQVEGGNG